MKILREHRSNLYDPEFDNGFLDLTLKATVTKEKNR